MAFCVNLRNTKLLAASIAASAGVMTYVSFKEIFAVKCVEAFQNSIGPKYAELAACGSFFGGMVLSAGLDWLIHRLDPEHDHHPELPTENAGEKESKNREEQEAVAHHASTRVMTLTTTAGSVGGEETGVALSVLQPAQETRELKHNAAGEAEVSLDVDCPISAVTLAVEATSSTPPGPTSTAAAARSIDQVVEIQPQTRPAPDHQHQQQTAEPPSIASTSAAAAAAPGGELDKQRKRLARMGLITGLSIGIHNFPEGLATFVAALSNPSVGVAICVAISLHNIPEGICVATPVFFATGSRWKAFFWASVSGFSEPVGAVIGYFLLSSIFNEAVYGVLFGMVAGIMVFISFKELLPTARQYDKEDKLTTKCVVGGMFFMALSLVLFTL